MSQRFHQVLRKMAGSFGYEKEHYKFIPKKIGRNSISGGEKTAKKDHKNRGLRIQSCLHQIQHLRSTRPIHFWEAIRAVKNNDLIKNILKPSI